MALTLYDEAKVRTIMRKYGIPESIWKSIMLTESGGNPSALADKPTETSKGLFQINIKAHPEYADVNLYDVATNAEIAARDFIAPAYRQAVTLTSDPYRQAEIVYSGLKNPDIGAGGGYLADGAGIRPKWTTETRQRFLGYWNTATNSNQTAGDVWMGQIQQNLDSMVAGSGGDLDASTGFMMSERFTNLQRLAKAGFIVGISIVGLVALFLLIKDTGGGDMIIKAVGGMTNGKSNPA